MRTISVNDSCYKKAFNIMGDTILELSTENGTLKTKIGSCDEEWIKKSEKNLLKQIDEEKSANLVMSRMRKTIE